MSKIVTIKGVKFKQYRNIFEQIEDELRVAKHKRLKSRRGKDYAKVK